jgi:hypothetical protein
MIPSTREILSAIYGAWTLLKLDPRGLDFFEVSVEAFWRSFFAAVIAAPGFALLRAIDYAEAESGSGFLPTLVVEFIAYVIVWAAFPLALHYLCLAIDRQQHYLRAVIALNWSVVIQIALTVPVHLIAVSGILSPGLASLAIFVVLMVTLFYAGFVARAALEITPPLAALVVAIDVVISLMVKALASGMLG